MSWQPAKDPEREAIHTETIELTVQGRPRDLGGLTVRRALPSMHRRLVGPFIFFDHMGPVDFEPGSGIDVRPHPHVNLATVTYLFEGEIVHRDSLGSEQAIRPGDVNWMTAGRGIVHSERSSQEQRQRGARVHGIQSWVGLPTSREETAPTFFHHAAATIPIARDTNAELRVVLGAAYGKTSPVELLSPTFYVEAKIDAAGDLALPSDYVERAAYVVSGAIDCDGHTFEDGALIVFRPGARATVHARERSHVMLLGGAPLDGERHIWWNFVSSSKERIEKAKRDWKEGAFPKVPGDEQEFIPLPET